MRAWRFSSVRSGSRPANGSAQRVVEGRPSSARSAARASRCRGCAASASRVAARARRGVRRRHRHAVTLLGAERVDGDERDERRVDAAATARARRGAKPFLSHVVARAEHERLVDLVDGVEQRRDLAGASGAPSRALAHGEGAERGRPPRAPRGRRAAARVAQARRPARPRVDVGDEQRPPRTAGRARSTVALVVDDERVAVEDELVLAADEPAERDRARGRRARAGRSSARARCPCRRRTARRRC